MHTGLIYCVVTISNKVGLYTVCRDSLDTDRRCNDFNEKTNNNRNLHSTLILFFLFNLFVKH